MLATNQYETETTLIGKVKVEKAEKSNEKHESIFPMKAVTVKLPSFLQSKIVNADPPSLLVESRVQITVRRIYLISISKVIRKPFFFSGEKMFEQTARIVEGPCRLAAFFPLNFPAPYRNSCAPRTPISH